MLYKMTASIAITFVGIPLMYLSYHWIRGKFFGEGRKKKDDKEEGSFQVLFFPDAQVACREEFTRRHGCTNQRCKFSHDPESAYAQLLRILHAARKSIDLCVYTITCAELAELLIELHKFGVKVRVITDKEMIDASGSQVGRFRMEGIQVRYRESSYLMHHKFAVLDGVRLINGSFNWTRQAITGNNENLVVTTDERLVRVFTTEYERLWGLYDPLVTPPVAGAYPEKQANEVGFKDSLPIRHYR